MELMVIWGIAILDLQCFESCFLIGWSLCLTASLRIQCPSVWLLDTEKHSDTGWVDSLVVSVHSCDDQLNSDIGY